MIVIGLISVLLDYFLLNTFNIRFFIFPMFSLIYLINSMLLKKDYLIVGMILILYSMLSGIILLPTSILLFIYYLNQKKKINYYLIIIIYIILYDFILYSFTTTNFIDNFYVFIYKLFITLPINIFYSFILYVLNKKINKYKLV